MNKKVLAIDDSKTLRMIIGKHLTPFGVEVIQAENGEQGITRARETSPDVILLDYNMPVLDGYHTLIELKTDPALKAIPVVMLTTETVKETVLKLAKLGLKDYIAKPFTRDVLLQKLNPLLGLYSGSVVPPEKPAQMNAAEAASAAAKQTILAVDDKANLLEQLKTFLGESFYFINAESGKAAMTAIEQKRFDYILLDLSLPDISGFDVLDAYLRSNRNGASIRKVAAMTLRTAQADIDRAISAGIPYLLYKPFSKEEVLNVANHMVSQQKEDPKKGQRFLTSKGKVKILECPGDKNARYRSVSGSLASDIVRELDDMAEEGLSRLVIRVGEGFLSDLSVTRKFIDLVDHATRLSLQVRLVADSDQALNALKQFAETAAIPTDTTLECALKAID
ncbi:MAG: response regulator [Acidobacteria bacterium]|nr:response regulator [Acidobacteriota bacterium]